MAFHNVLQRLQQAGSRRFNVLLFGAPGVGKGTFAKLIHQDFDFRQFSTGDYFREAIKKAESGEGELDAFTLKVNKILKSGQLVDDAVVVDVLKRLQENPATFMDGRYANARGIVLDGVPRTLQQAKLLDSFLNVDVVINLFNKEEVLVQKLAGRRVCPECNRNFNVAHVRTECGYHMEPLLPKGDDPTICDGDHPKPVKLITRSDDTEEVVWERLQVYQSQTLPILEFYQSQPTTLIDFEAKNGKKDYPQLRSLLCTSLEEQFAVYFSQSSGHSHRV